MRNVRLRTLAVAAGFALVSCLVGGAAAAEPEGDAFTSERFRSLQQQGGLVLVRVAARECDVCAEQTKVVERYRKEHPEVPLQVLRVDFEAQKDWVSHFGAPRSGVLVLYRGFEKVWSSVEEPDASAIPAALEEAAESR